MSVYYYYLFELFDCVSGAHPVLNEVSGGDSERERWCPVGEGGGGGEVD